MPWLFLSDPESYSFKQLFEREREVWDGINGTMAQKYLREIASGDRVIGYHTAPEKQIVCELAVVSGPYQNPKIKDKKNVVVDVKPVRWFARPIPLAEMRSNPRLRNMKMFQLVRPIAVSPLTEAEYDTIVALAG